VVRINPRRVSDCCDRRNDIVSGNAHGRQIVTGRLQSLGITPAGQAEATTHDGQGRITTLSQGNGRRVEIDRSALGKFADERVPFTRGPVKHDHQRKSAGAIPTSPKMNFLPGLPLRVADFDLQASESAVLAPQSLQARPFKLKSQEACLPQCSRQFQVIVYLPRSVRFATQVRTSSLDYCPTSGVDAATHNSSAIQVGGCRIVPVAAGRS